MAKIKAYELINRSDLASSDAFLVETDAGTRTINALNLLSGLTKCIEVLDDALDTATDTTTIYLHKVTSGSSTYIKGTVICTGSNGGYTQVRFRRSGSIEYRTGSSSSWGEWIKVCTLSDVYTKQETDAAIAAVAGLHFAIVPELPPIAQASPNMIYLTPVSGQVNVYSQHICINNAWRDLGTNNIDLSGKADVDSVYSKEDADDKFATKTALNDKADSTNVYSKIDADAKFALISTSMGLAPVITTSFLPDTDVIPIGQVYIFKNRGYIRTSDDQLPSRHQQMMSIDDLNEVWDTTDALEYNLSQKMSYAQHTDNTPVSDLVSGQGFYSDDTVGFKTKGSNSKKAYTTEYIDNALAGVENVSEVLDNALDTALDIKTLYLHRVTSGSSTYVKGTVICTGSNGGYTQFRFRRSGGIEYRTGTGSPISWGGYSATGDWKRLATLDDIPDIPEVVNPWKNKTYISHGDSITWQDGRAYGSGTHQGETARGYQTVLKELLELGTHTNKGVNGATLADRAGVSVSGVSTIKSIASYASYDLCTIAFGTNDFKQGVPLGTLGAATDTVFNTTTFYGAFREAVKYILTSSPTIRLVLMTPLQRDQHDYSVDTVNAIGLKLLDYVNAVKLIGKMYGLPVCDLYSNSGITELTLSTYTIDGLHPNDEGFKRMAEVLADTLTSGGNNDATDLSEYVKEDDVYSIGEADETFAKLAPLNPTAQEIAALPSGQLYSDTANHKGVIKDGQSFYGTEYIDDNYRKTIVSDKYPPWGLSSWSYPRAATMFEKGTVWVVSGVRSYILKEILTNQAGGTDVVFKWEPQSRGLLLLRTYPYPAVSYGNKNQVNYGNFTAYPISNRSDGDLWFYRENSDCKGIYLCTAAIDNESSYYTKWEEITRRFTTLSGYGIVDAYTKTEINNMIGDIESLLAEV